MDYATQVALYKAFAEKWSRNTISNNVYLKELDDIYYDFAFPGNTDADGNICNIPFF